MNVENRRVTLEKAVAKVLLYAIAKDTRYKSELLFDRLLIVFQIPVHPLHNAEFCDTDTETKF